MRLNPWGLTLGGMTRRASHPVLCGLFTALLAVALFECLLFCFSFGNTQEHNCHQLGPEGQCRSIPGLIHNRVHLVVDQTGRDSGFGQAVPELKPECLNSGLSSKIPDLCLFPVRSAQLVQWPLCNSNQLF